MEDDVFVSEAGSYTITVDEPQNVNSLLLSRPGVFLSLSSTASLTVFGNLRVEHGGIENEGTLSCASLDFSGGSIRGSGRLLLAGKELKLPLSSTRSISLAWNPSAGPDVAGYRVYYGSDDGLFGNTISLENTNSVRISELVPTVLYGFAATAFDSVGLESGPSQPVFYRAPPAPGIGPLPDRFVELNTGSRVFYLLDITTGGASVLRPLKISAFSSNPQLIPHPSVFHTHGESIGTLFCSPVSNVSGFADITLLLNDGQVTVSRTFRVVVSPPNEPPTLDPIEALSVFENSRSVSVRLSGITSGDPGETQELSVFATSSDSATIGDLQLFYSSPDSEAVLTFSTFSAQPHPAIISVTVDDGQLWNSFFTRQFPVYVEPAPLAGVPRWRPFRPASRSSPFRLPYP